MKVWLLAVASVNPLAVVGVDYIGANVGKNCERLSGLLIDSSLGESDTYILMVE